MKVAIFEDNSVHRIEAREVAEKLGIEVVMYTKVEDLHELESVFSYNKEKREYEAKVDGIITDLYMPATYSPEPEHPYGLVIAAHAFKHNVPFVLCTAGFHHGAKYQMVHEFIMAMGWPQMIDCGDYTIRDGEVEHKNWKGAFERIIKMVKEKGGD